MKRKLILIAVILFGMFSLIQAQDLFTNLSYDEVVEQSKLNKKPYYVDLTASWCFPCQLMNETVFTDQMVIQYTKNNYTAVQLDIDDFDAMILKSEYSISVLPTILFFNYRGKLIGRLEGLQTGTNFLEFLKKYN